MFLSATTQSIVKEALVVRVLVQSVSYYLLAYISGQKQVMNISRR